MAQLTINYTATSDLMTSPTTWMTSNVASHTYDSTTQQGTLTLNDNVTVIGNNAFLSKSALLSITIPEGITSLGSWAIGSCSNITSINLPNSVSDIGAGALAQNPLLTTVNLPTLLTNLGGGALAGCTSLTIINIPSTLTTLNENVFANCTNLSSIDLSNITNILSNAFSQCTSLTSIDLSNVIQIDGAFNGCTGITGKLNLPKCEILGTTAFRGCTGITEINAPSLISIQSNMYATEGAFSNCTGLTKVTLGSALTSIGRYAFYGCSNLTSVTCEATTPPTLGSNNFTASGDTLYVPSASVSAYQSDASWSAAFTNIEAIPVTIHYTATADLKSFSTWLTNNVDQNASTWDSGTGEGVLVLNSGVTEIGSDAFRGCTTITKINIPVGITTINSSVFQSCSNLVEVILPEGLTSIGNFAFNGLSNITSITFPSTLTSINNAFWNNNNLNVVYCKALVPPTLSGSNFSNPNTVLFVPSSVVNDYKNSAWVSRFSAIYPYNGNGVITYHSSTDLSNYSTWIINNAISTTYDSTTQIGTIEIFPYEVGKEAFKNCSTLTEVSFTNIIRIWECAFERCTHLTEATFGEPLTTIGQNSFINCSSLTTLNFGNSLTTIGNSVFTNCSSLTTFTIPASVTTIYRSSFQYTRWWETQSNSIIYKDNWCLGYKSSKPTGSLTIDSCLHIAISAFSECTGLTEVTLPESLTTIGQSAFQGCTGLTEVTLPESLTTIGQSAFNGCTGLTEVTLPESLTTIGFYTFSNCTSLTTIYWNAINVTSYTGYINVFGNTVPIETVIFGDSVTNIPTSALHGCTGLTEVTLPESLTTIGSYAFQNCTGLTEVTLPDSLTTIGVNAFNGCTGLTQLTLPDSLTTIGANAFNGCTSLTQLTLPESLTSIGQSAFRECTSLTTIYWNAINITSYPAYSTVFGNNNPIDTVIFGDSVIALPNNAFTGCTSLTEVTLPDSVTTIGSSFSNCTGLTQVTLGKSLTTIGSGAFKGCTSLTTIYWNAINVTSIYGYGNVFGSSTPIDTIIFGDSVIALPNSAFKSCTSLTSVTLSSSITTIDYDAFNCPNLLSVTSLATTPPTLNSYNFTASGDTLYMPMVSKSAYQSANEWRTAFTYYKGLCEISTSTDGNGTITPTELVVEGESFTVIATPNEHYKVSHFIVDGVDVGTIDNYTFQNLDADHTVYVEFELITHTITATAFEGGAIIPSGVITINEGENQSFDIIPLEGYGILAVFIDGVQIEPVETYTFENIEADHTIQALFYKLRSNGFNRDEMLDINFILQDYLEQLKKRD